MRSYELMFFMVPTVTEEEVDKVVSQLEGVIKADQGELSEVEKMGKKNLAYRIGKFGEGYYVLLKLKAKGSLVKELERRLKVMDTVLRHISVRTDERMKGFEKAKVRRAKKAQRKSPGIQPGTAGSAL
jgi:small subunit ribosomal protein S6